MKSREPLETLSAIVRDAYENTFSDFYRRIYQRAGCVPEFDAFDPVQWRRLPLISKNELIERPYHERAFLPIEDALFIHVSSGTTKSPTVLNLRNKLWKAYNHKEFADRMMFFRGGAFLYYVYGAEDIASICGDMRDHEGTARLAGRFQIEGIMTTAPHLCALTPYLAKEMDLSKIKLIVSSGDRYSASALEFLRSNYPNAVIRNTYGTAETGGLHAQSCEEIERSGKNYVHFSERDVYVELVADDGNVVESEGELVMTLLWEENMFPVIRFRTGDIARLVTNVCSCQRETYEMLGRAGFDFARIPGGLLKTEELERVMGAHKDKVTDMYELHVFDPAPGSLRIRTELRVQPLGGAVSELTSIADAVSRALFVGPGKTYEQGVDEGMYEPLVCTVLPNQASAAKIMRIVRHGN